MKEVREVQIVLRDGWQMETPKVDVLWECPTCGEKMGEPKGKNFFEDGDSYHCDVWENPCGHVARYEELKMKSETGFISWNEIKASRKSKKAN